MSSLPDHPAGCAIAYPAATRSTRAGAFPAAIPHTLARAAAILRCLLCLCLLAFAGRALAVAEIEPNNTCATAQNLGTLALNGTVVVNGALTTPPTTPDVDFFQVTGVPGTMLRIHLAGFSDGVDTVLNTMAGAFDSSCNTVQPAVSGDPVVFTIPVPADGVLNIGVTSCCDSAFAGTGLFAGTYTLTLFDEIPVTSISGRVVDAGTLVPLAGVMVNLNECADAACAGIQYINNVFTDANGMWSLTTSITGQPLDPGTYVASATDFTGNYQSGSTGQFVAAGGQAVNAPDIPLQKIPVLASLTGRLVDSVTHVPLPGTTEPFAQVELNSCLGYDCVSFSGSTDVNGRFLFSRDFGGHGIPAGANISVFLGADQYQQFVGNFTAGAANQAQDLGDIPLVSNPVRFTLQQGCSTVPLAGGTCTYKVLITNGQATAQQGEAWATIAGNALGTFVGDTLFQTGEPQEMTLAPATRTARSSRSASFSFSIPGNVPTYASLCPTFWFGLAPGNPQLNTLGAYSAYQYCVQRTATGYVPATTDQVNALRKEARAHEARERAVIGH